MNILILDGYVDEPGTLGVPPYLAPEPRKLVGVCETEALDWQYMTAGEYREQGLPEFDLLLVYGGVTVPGNYLRGRPLSEQEAAELVVPGREVFFGGPLATSDRLRQAPHLVRKDLSAYFYTYLAGEPEDRRAHPEEREAWLQAGARLVEAHPLPADRLLAELSTYRGCVRYFTGGCSFCSEPLFGRPDFRTPENIIAEAGRLYERGVRNFRLGGQSCIISYGCDQLGEKEKPRPVPGQLRKLFSGLRERCPDLDVLHVDNANPAVMAEHPAETKEILKILKQYTTPGNILAFGMESADPSVIEQNNLNARPAEVRRAVELTNEVGRERGANGMPALLPGLNFLAGLAGETAETYRLNFKFLESLLSADLWVRRINIRQVLGHRREFELTHHKEFKQFKKRVREEIDQPLLERMFPRGTVLRDVLMEKREGNNTFGRQFGTYPLLAGVKYPLELDSFYDLRVTEYGYRSLTGVESDLKFSEASVKQLEAIPGLGSSRASKLFVEQPATPEEFRQVIDDPKAADQALKYLQFERTGNGG